MNRTKKKEVNKDAAIAGISTFIVDGAIQFFMLKGKVPIAISVDSITNTVNTVLGSSVVLAIMLAMIMTVINYIKIKERKVPFFPNAFWLMIRHGFFSFGVVTALSIMWQRYLGTIEVGLIPAVLLIAAIAGIVSATINYLTIKRCILPEQNHKTETLKYQTTKP